MVLDGTGTEAFSADIGIKDSRIVALGDLASKNAQTRIDASGLVVSPGFIDLHTHTERDLLNFPDIQNYTRQGVTTVLGGNCGGSPLPIDQYLAKPKPRG